VGLIWVTEHSGINGNASAIDLAEEDAAQRFVGPEPPPGGLEVEDLS